MKSSALKPFLAAAAFLLSAFCFLLFLHAGSTLFVGNLATVDTTTSNSTAVTAGTFTPPRAILYFQHAGGLTNTNALTFNLQLSSDNTNFVTIATHCPTNTNSGSYSYVFTFTSSPVYYRVQTVTTQSVQVGGSLQY